MGARQFSYFKNSKIIQEKRKYYDSIEQGIIPRSKRNPTNLPDSWDDISHSITYIKKSWKRFHKTKKQYIRPIKKDICLYCKYWSCSVNNYNGTCIKSYYLHYNNWYSKYYNSLVYDSCKDFKNRK
jgi:hypothetical protein